jgi:[ribosomal protein S18]-alanine N-acetyltransferase
LSEPAGRCWLAAALPEDVAALAEIERQCYTHPWPESAFARAVRDPQVRVLALRERGGAGEPLRGLLAYCVIQLVADELQIHNLAVREGVRRRGLARLLLRLVLDLGRRRAAREAFLEVRASNAPAIALYRGCGFEVSGTRRDYYERPREDAVLMRLALESLNWPVPHAKFDSTALKA